MTVSERPLPAPSWHSGSLAAPGSRGWDQAMRPSLSGSFHSGDDSEAQHVIATVSASSQRNLSYEERTVLLLAQKVGWI